MRLSEVMNGTTVTAERPRETSMRLSDAMRVTPYSIPPEPVDKGIHGNLAEGVSKAFLGTPQIPGKMLTTYGDYIRTSADKYEKQGVIFGIKPLISSKTMGERIYNAGMNMVSISPYGDVYPCIAIRKKCGSLRDKTFAEIWEHSSVLSEIRSMTFGDLSKCKACSLVSYCDRCTGIAFLEEGDILGPSSSACQKAEILRSLVSYK